MILPHKFRVIKSEIRVLGVDDGVFRPHAKGFALIIGVVFRGGHWLDGVMHTKIEVDGLDATDKIATMITSSPHYKQLRIVMLNGVTCAGFNVINLRKLNMKTCLPIIAVTRHKPNFKKIREALKHLPNYEERWNTIRDTGTPFKASTGHKGATIYAQIRGIAEEDARRILRLTSTRSCIPEPLRVAHLVASGVSFDIN